MKETLYLAILFGSLLCNVVCDIHENNPLHSKKTNDDHVSEFENKPLFYDEKNSSTEGVDGVEILVEENGDRVLALEEESTLRPRLELEENLHESGGDEFSDDFETKEEVSEIFKDEDNTDFLSQAQTITDLRDFIKNKVKYKPKYFKYTLLKGVRTLLPLKKKPSIKDKIFSEEVSEKDDSNKEGSVEEIPDEEEWFSNENISSQDRLLKSTRNCTINRFLCRTENEKDSVIVHGARAWTFETQDVNLTLTYPMAQPYVLEKHYIITGFSVLLVTDGVDARGYINSGGVLKDNISLSFISPGISSLFYEFQVYGIPRYTKIDVELMNTFYLCS